MKKQRRTLFSSVAILVAGIFASGLSQAQNLSVGAVESVVSGMMERPVSLFLGLPVEYSGVSVSAVEGSDAEFDVVFENANMLGLPLGDVSLDAEVSASGALQLTANLAPVLTGVLGMLDTTLEVDTFRLSMSINVEAQAIERVTLTVDDLYAAPGGTTGRDYLKLDGVIFDYDERDEHALVTIDFGIDDLVFALDGEEIVALETIGASAELINIAGWYLHEEINNALMQFFMANAGAVTPTEAIASVMESLAPLFEGEMTDLRGSIDIGEVTTNSLSLLDLDGKAVFDGLSLRSHYNYEALTDNTDIDIGSLELLAEYPWSDDGTSFELLTFDGGTITGRSTFAREYDVSPLADILRYVAEAVRGLDAEVLVDPSSALINLSFGSGGPLLDWYTSIVKTSDLEVALGNLAVQIPQGPGENLDFVLEGFELASFLAIDGDSNSDTQSLSGRLLGLEAVLPEEVGFSAGEISMSTQINDSLNVLRDIMNSAAVAGLNLGDGIGLVMALYLPDLSVGVKDLFGYTSTPTGMGVVSVALDSADIDFSTADMRTDQARISQLIAFAGLDVVFTDEFMFDPVLVDLVLNPDGRGLLPTDATIQVDLTDIPMAMILSIASNVMLPPIETMVEPDFDPTSLALAGAALVSPLLGSPPSLVVQPSDISGGMVELTASGRVDIAPLVPPNYSVGSVTIRVSGVADAQAKVQGILDEIANDPDSAFPDTYETLQQILGGLAIASGFGIPASDGALEFILDIPAGEPASINGLPIPVPF